MRTRKITWQMALSKLAFIGMWTLALIGMATFALVGSVTLLLWFVFSLVWDLGASFVDPVTNRRKL